MIPITENRLCVRNPASRLLQIGQNSEKWQWRHNLPIWLPRQHFWCCFVSLVKFSFWSNFHVNIITGFGIMTIFFYKRLTRNLEFRNTPVWVFPNIWRLGWVMDTKFKRISLIECYWMLQNVRVTAFTVFELLREIQLGGSLKLPPSPHHPDYG